MVASESANNACSGGDIMTTLVLGVPGSATTGILLGALTMHGLQAGPNFVAQQQTLVYGIIAAAIISQVFMVAAAVFAAYSLSGTLSVPTRDPGADPDAVLGDRRLCVAQRGVRCLSHAGLRRASAT